MSSGLAFGATAGAGSALRRSQAGIDISQSGQEVEDFFGNLGRQTLRASSRGQRQGAGLTILGLAALSALSGGSLPLSLLIGKGLLASSAAVGIGAGIGSRRASEKAARKAGIDTFDPKFHRRATRRGIEDVRQIIGESAVGKGIEAGATTFGLGQLGGTKSFLDFVMKMAGQSVSPSGIPFDPSRNRQLISQQLGF